MCMCISERTRRTGLWAAISHTQNELWGWCSEQRTPLFEQACKSRPVLGLESYKNWCVWRVCVAEDKWCLTSQAITEEQPGTREGRRGEKDGGGVRVGKELAGDLSYLVRLNFSSKNITFYLLPNITFMQLVK